MSNSISGMTGSSNASTLKEMKELMAEVSKRIIVQHCHIQYIFIHHFLFQHLPKQFQY